MSFLLYEDGGAVLLEDDGGHFLLELDDTERALDWLAAETAIRDRIIAEWPGTAFASSLPLVWENENKEYYEFYMAINIEGIYAEKTLYGGTGKRSSVEAGIVYYHAFVPTTTGKRAALGAVLAMSSILELRTLAHSVNLAGANPPSPVAESSFRDDQLPSVAQPGGNYYRCSGSTPFILIGTR